MKRKLEVHIEAVCLDDGDLQPLIDEAIAQFAEDHHGNAMDDPAEGEWSAPLFYAGDRVQLRYRFTNTYTDDDGKPAEKSDA